MHHENQFGSIIRINVDLSLGKMISLLDCVYIVSTPIITSYSLLILNPVATSKSGLISWHHKQWEYPKTPGSWESNRIQSTWSRVGDRRKTDCKSGNKNRDRKHYDWVELFFISLERGNVSPGAWDEKLRVSEKILTDCGVRKIIQANFMKPSGKIWSFWL